MNQTLKCLHGKLVWTLKKQSIRMSFRNAFGKISQGS